MTTITQNTGASLAAVGISASTMGDSEARKAAPLRGAAEFARFDEGKAKALGVPELREPHVERQATGGGRDVEDIIRTLLAVNLKLQSNAREQIGANSKLERTHSESIARTQRSAGLAEMSGAMSQSSIMVGSAGMSAQRAFKATSLQLHAAKVNMPMAGRAGVSAASPNVLAGAKGDFAKYQGDLMSRYHEGNFKASKMHTQSEAIKGVGAAATKVAEGGQSVAVSGHRADQAVVQGEASIAARTTEASFKDSSSIDELKNRLLAVRDAVAQSQDNASAHIARAK